jgi:DNA-binding transcriptional regulator YiaG
MAGRGVIVTNQSKTGLNQMKSKCTKCSKNFTAVRHKNRLSVICSSCRLIGLEEIARMATSGVYVLRDLRAATGIKRNDFAEKLGISQGRMSDYERKVRNPPHAVAKKMIELFAEHGQIVHMHELLNRHSSLKENQLAKRGPYEPVSA